MYPNDPNGAPDPYQPPVPQTWQQPTQPVSSQTPSIDYLNQISTPQKRSFQFSRKQIAIVCSVVFVAFLGVAILVLVRNAGGQSVTQASQIVYASGTSLHQVVNDSQKSIKNTRLSALNSTLNLQLSSANTSLATVLTQNNITTSEFSSTVTLQADTTELEAKLDEATLLSTFDDVYTREMNLQLTRYLVRIQNLIEATNNESLTTTLQTIYNNIEPIRDNLASIGR